MKTLYSYEAQIDLLIEMSQFFYMFYMLNTLQWVSS